MLSKLSYWRSGVRWSSVASGRCTGVAVACGGVSGCGHSGRSVAGHRGRVSRGGSVSWSRIHSAGHGSSDRGCVGGSIASRSCVAHWSTDRGRVGAGSVARHGGCIGGGGSVARRGGSIAHRRGSIARRGGSVARRGGSVACWSTIRLWTHRVLRRRRDRTQSNVTVPAATPLGFVLDRWVSAVRVFVCQYQNCSAEGDWELHCSYAAGRQFLSRRRGWCTD